MSETPAEYLTRPRIPKPHDHRCQVCNRLLGRFMLAPGSRLEIRCSRCSHVYTHKEPVTVRSLQVFAWVADSLNGATPLNIREAVVGLLNSFDNHKG